MPPEVERVVTPQVSGRGEDQSEYADGEQRQAEYMLRAARPLLTEPDEEFARQLGAVYRHVRLDAQLPHMATEEELRGFRGPVAVFATGDDPFFPGEAVLARAR